MKSLSVFFGLFLSAYAQSNVYAGDKVLHKMHIYLFCECTPGTKSSHIFNTDKSQTFQALDVINYSVAQLFSLAVLEGKHIPKENIIIPNAVLRKLSERQCYRIATYKSYKNGIYKMMLNSLQKQFPGFTAVVEIRNGKQFLVFK